MRQVGVDLVRDVVAGTAAAGAAGVARLGHEAGQHAVEGHVVEPAVAGQEDKAVHRLRGRLGQQLNSEGSARGHLDVG